MVERNSVRAVQDQSEGVENQRFAAARAASATCWEIEELGGCVICWGKGQWLGITDADWHRLAWNAPRTVMSCGHCQGTGLARPIRHNARDGASKSIPNRVENDKSREANKP